MAICKIAETFCTDEYRTTTVVANSGAGLAILGFWV